MTRKCSKPASANGSKDLHDRLEKHLGRGAAKFISSAYTRSEQSAGLVAGVILGVLAKKLAVAILTTMLVYVGLPYLMMLGYSLGNGLPVFDVFDALGDRTTVFCVIFLIGVLAQIILALVPSWIWATDKTVSDLSWYDSSEFGNQALWIRLRWLVAFGPGILLIGVLTLGFAATRSAEIDRIYNLNLGYTIIGVVLFILIASIIGFRLGGFGNEFKSTSYRFVKWKSVFRHPHNFF